jgi:hypothetical protein
VDDERKGYRVSRWSSAVTAVGVSALALSVAVLWTILSAPQAVLSADTPTTLLVFGRWAWQLVTIVAAWL